MVAKIVSCVYSDRFDTNAIETLIGIGKFKVGTLHGALCGGIRLTIKGSEETYCMKTNGEVHYVWDARKEETRQRRFSSKTYFGQVVLISSEDH